MKTQLTHKTGYVRVYIRPYRQALEQALAKARAELETALTEYQADKNIAKARQEKNRHILLDLYVEAVKKWESLFPLTRLFTPKPTMGESALFLNKMLANQLNLPLELPTVELPLKQTAFSEEIIAIYAPLDFKHEYPTVLAHLVDYLQSLLNEIKDADFATDVYLSVDEAQELGLGSLRINHYT